MQLFGINSSPASFIRRKTFQVWSNSIRRHTYLLFHEFSFTTPKITLSLHTRFCISSLFPNAFFRGTVRRQQKVGLPSTGYNSPSVAVLRLICALVDHEKKILFFHVFVVVVLTGGKGGQCIDWFSRFCWILQTKNSFIWNARTVALASPSDLSVRSLDPT